MIVDEGIQSGIPFCVVVKHLEQEGFLITAFPTKGMKEGETIWTK